MGKKVNAGIFATPNSHRKLATFPRKTHTHKAKYKVTLSTDLILAKEKKLTTQKYRIF